MTAKTAAPDINYSTYIGTSPDRVYEAITTGKGWDAWFTQGTTVDLSPGGRIQLRWKDFGPRRVNMEDSGPVLEAVPDRKFAFQWSPGSHPTTVTFGLEELGAGTVVNVVESGYNLEQDDLETLVDCAAGWGEALTLLKHYLEHGVTYGEVPTQ